MQIAVGRHDPAGADGAAEPSDQRLETPVLARHDGREKPGVAGGATQRTMRHADGRPDVGGGMRSRRSMSTAPSGSRSTAARSPPSSTSRTVRSSKRGEDDDTVLRATSRPPRARGRVTVQRSEPGREAAPALLGEATILRYRPQRRRARATLSHADTDDGAAPGPIGQRSSVTASLGTPSRAATAGTETATRRPGNDESAGHRKIPTARLPALTTSVPAGGPSTSAIATSVSVHRGPAPAQRTVAA